MKKLVIVLALAVLVTSCIQELSSGTTEPDTGTPEIKKVIVSDTYANLLNGVEQNAFVAGDAVFFGLTITDTDLDLDKIVITQKSQVLYVDPFSMPIQIK